MRKCLVCFLLVMTLLFSLSALGEGENLLQNPDLEASDALGLAEGWYKDMWDESASLLETSADGLSGRCLKITNQAANDARFCQDVSVEPDTLYEIRCMVKAEDVSGGDVGACLSARNTFSYSESVFDTQGEWVPLTLYGRTGADQTELTLWARLGGYSATCTGTAWFDDFELRKISTLPEGATEQDLSPVTFSAGSNTSTQTDEDAEPQRHTQAWLLFAFGMALAFVAVCRKSCRIRSLKCDFKTFALLLIPALILRLAVGSALRGYYTDVNCFLAWSERIFDTGFLRFYQADYFCDYPPLYMAMLWVISALRHVLGISVNSTAHILLLKLLPMVFDLLLASLIYGFARKRAGERVALLLGLICALNPAAIVDSAAWGQIDSVFTFFTLLGAVLLADYNYALALPMIALAMLIKPQALLFAPLGLFALAVELVRRHTAKDLRRVAIGLAASLGLLLLFALVFHQKDVSPVSWLVNLYGGTMSGYPRITVNALNLYELLGFNWDALSQHRLWTVFAWICFGGAYLYSFAVYFFSKRRDSLFLAAGTLILLICAFGPMIHERYVYPAVALLLMAYACSHDRRLLISVCTVSVTLFLNQVLVLQGGMTPANYGHLQDSEKIINHLLSALVVLNALFTAYVAADIAFLRHTLPGGLCAGRARVETPDWQKAPSWKMNLTRLDAILMAAVTALYAVVAFVNLGSTKAPQTSWVSSQTGEQVTFDLGSVQTYKMEYYGGICNKIAFQVELSDDGETWTQPVWAQYDQGKIFRWLIFVPADENQNNIAAGSEAALAEPGFNYYSALEKYPTQTSRYVRITAQAEGLVLSEVGFVNSDGNPLPVTLAANASAPENAQALIDEQDTVPDHPSYYNSTYFDEIYHARTAYEHLHGLSTYEWTHPPLGKVLMMVGIRLFGMTPFGWRFMGALMGVLMLPVMYLLAKQLGASTKVSCLAMLLLALDSMHFTQTRIATIDSYAVFWIMLMYLFMFRYVKMNFHRESLGRTLVPLGLCGVTMGVAWATKWIGIYASAGLALLFFWSLISRCREYFQARKLETRPDWVQRHWKNVLVTLLFCLVFFVAVPLLIYYFSYYWQMAPQGGLSVKKVWDLQLRIYNYHAGLGGDTHFFRSPWYEWPVIAWPMWYYNGSPFLAANQVSSISCMGNPAVWWTGLVAILALSVRVAGRRKAGKTEILILAGFLSQYLPWVLVPRSTFIYHYFASVPFIILATVYFLGLLEKKRPRAFLVCGGVLTALALSLFVMFYPIESGLPMSRDYAKYLQWFDWYNYDIR